MRSARTSLAAAGDLVALADGVAADPHLDAIGVALGRQLIDDAIGELVSARFSLTETIDVATIEEMAA